MEKKGKKINGSQATPSKKVFSNIQKMGQKEIYDSKPYIHNNTNAIVACLILYFSTVAVFRYFLRSQSRHIASSGSIYEKNFRFYCKTTLQPDVYQLGIQFACFFM